MPPAKVYPVNSDAALAWQHAKPRSPRSKFSSPRSGEQVGTRRRKVLDPSATGRHQRLLRRLQRQFYHQPVGAAVKFSGASADVVSHEVGHALLDTIRPELWDSPFPEVAAFHEAFGDCIAMLTEIADKDMRKELVKVINKRNFVETWGEELSWTVLKVKGATWNASKPRQARNKFQWALPSTLPADGPGGVLINEPHSFGQVFTVFLISWRCRSRTPKNEAALWTAASSAARALFAAAKAAAITPRFYQAIGCAMALQDTSAAGKQREAIRKAFEDHGITLGSAAAAVPRATVAGSRLRRGAVSSPALMSSTTADLRVRLGAEHGARLRVRSVELGQKRFVEASHERRIDLTGLASYLKGVSASGSEPVLVAPVRGAMAIMSSMPDANATHDEVHAFVKGLVARGEIAHGRGKPGTAQSARRAAVASVSSTTPLATHRVVTQRGEATLQRVRFACGCCSCR
jgi:hypothetical protein